MKYSKPIMNAVNRFPLVYKRQAFAMLDQATHEAVRKTFDGVICASMLVLIQEFGFGTKENSTRLKRYMEKMQGYVDYNCELYDEDFVAGMIRQLKEHGVEYIEKE